MYPWYGDCRNNDDGEDDDVRNSSLVVGDGNSIINVSPCPVIMSVNWFDLNPLAFTQAWT